MTNKKRRIDNKARAPGGPKIKGQRQPTKSQKKQQVQQKQAQAQSQPLKKQHQQQHQQKPIVPFDPTDRILLIGEGDLSFAASLVRHHGCRNLVATVLEKSQAELVEKYPHAAANIEAILSPPSTKNTADETNAQQGDDDDDNDDDPSDSESDDDELRRRVKQARQQSQQQGGSQKKDKKLSHQQQQQQQASSSSGNKILYGLDATRPLPASASRPRPLRIIFNFPHVGGKSTDVNRQVRHNQSLLVSFFERAVRPALAPGGTVVVTLFESEPYTLWNVRDLARHAGLAVDRSFRFDWSIYPGYHHARTLGVVKSKKEEVAEDNNKADGDDNNQDAPDTPAGPVGAGWRGEDRPSRSYIFYRKDEKPVLPSQLAAAAAAAAGKKRRATDSDSENEDVEYDDE